MFGRILDIHDYTVILENGLKRVDTSIIGVHIVFEKQYKVVAEIVSMTYDRIVCNLVGEFINNRFVSGVVHKPNSDASIRIVNRDEVIYLLGNQEIDSADSLYIGKSTIYEGFNVSARLNDLFSNHFAILGNTGSGKSCSVSRFFQNLFYRRRFVPNNSRFV